MGEDRNGRESQTEAASTVVKFWHAEGGEFRNSLQPFIGAPYDERVYNTHP